MIEFLFWEGCPSHTRALGLLVDQMDALGIPRDELRITEIHNKQDAERNQFVGSPTIRADGKDIQDPGDEHFGLECRLFHRRDGRPSPLPDREDLKDLLTAYAQHHRGG
jgi:hypothetical protein